MSSHTGLTLHITIGSGFLESSLCGLVPAEFIGEHSKHAWINPSSHDAVYVARYYKCEECWELLPIVLLGEQ